MAETVILGLLWLKKWNLSIDWGSNKWQLRRKAKTGWDGETAKS